MFSSGSNSGSNTYDDGLTPDRRVLSSFEEYAVLYIFHHADMAEAHGLPQHSFFKTLEEKKLLTILCHCFLLINSIKANDQELFNTRALEKASCDMNVSEDDLVQLIECIASNQYRHVKVSGAALSAACTIQNANIARLIIQDGLQNRNRICDEIKQYSCFSPTTLVPLLLRTIQYGSIQEVTMLLGLGIDVNAVDPNSKNEPETALQTAVYWNWRATFEHLIKSGANFDRQQRLFSTTLHVTMRRSQMEMLTAFLKSNTAVDLQAGTCESAMQAAAYNDHKQVIEALCNAGVDVDIQSGKYGTALQTATYQGYLDIVDMLLGAGADVSVQGGQYGTALRAAACSDSDDTVAIIEKLLTYGASIDTRVGTHGSALHAASEIASIELVSDMTDRQERGHIDHSGVHREAPKLAVVQTLLRHGAKITVDDWREPGLIRAYLDLFISATESCSIELIHTLLHATTEDGSNDGKATDALRSAALFGSSKQIDMLLKHGARPPSAGIRLHSRDYRDWNWNLNWIWDEYREARSRLSPLYDWLTIHED